MTVTASANLRLKIITDYTEEDLWGGHTNDNLNRIDEAIRGITTYAVQTGVSEYTVPEQDYTGGGAHKPIIKITGAQDTDLDVILPAKPQVWAIINATTDGGGGPYDITFKTAAGTGSTFTHGQRGLIAGDGTNIEGIIAPGNFLSSANNLSDLTDVSAAQNNLQLNGALIDSNNLGDVGSAATARGNLGIDSSLINSLLPTSGVIAGTYSGITVNTKGIVTAATAVTPTFLKYESSYASIALATVYTFTHGLGGRPNFNFIIWLKCIVTEGGFAVGDEIPLSVCHDTNVIDQASFFRARTQPMLWLPNDTQVKIRTPTSRWHIGQASGGEYVNMTPANWQMKLSASRQP